MVWYTYTQSYILSRIYKNIMVIVFKHLSSVGDLWTPCTSCISEPQYSIW